MLVSPGPFLASIQPRGGNTGTLERNGTAPESPPKPLRCTWGSTTTGCSICFRSPLPTTGKTSCTKGWWGGGLDHRATDHDQHQGPAAITSTIVAVNSAPATPLEGPARPVRRRRRRPSPTPSTHHPRYGESLRATRGLEGSGETTATAGATEEKADGGGGGGAGAGGGAAGGGGGGGGLATEAAAGLSMLKSASEKNDQNMSAFERKLAKEQKRALEEVGGSGVVVVVGGGGHGARAFPWAGAWACRPDRFLCAAGCCRWGGGALQVAAMGAMLPAQRHRAALGLPHGHSHRPVR